MSGKDRHAGIQPLFGPTRGTGQGNRSAVPSVGEANRPVVIAVGAINVDFVTAVDRLPGPGQTVVGPGLTRHGGGKGANAAVAAARLGGDVRLVGAVGDDDTGVAALGELREEGVGVEHIAVLPGVSTGVALIVVDGSGENQIAVAAGANFRLDPQWVHACVSAALASAGCVLVSTEIPPAAVAAAVEAASAADVPYVLNPAPAIPVVTELLKHAPLLTPNTSEIADLEPLQHQIENAHPGRNATLARAQMLARRSGAAVVVTCGSDGVLVASPRGAAEHIAPRTTHVRDTTGAGDTFNGAMAVGLAAGYEVSGAAHIANAAAALSVTQIGARAGMPSEAELTAALEDH